MKTKDKCIAELLTAVDCSIVDKEILGKYNIDTIVNAAKPTLMGSTQGVDGAIHAAIPKFNQKIISELKMDEVRDVVCCQRGEAVLTSGYNLSKYIIHVVGASYDGKDGKKENCSSSRVQILESCYREVIRIAREHHEIAAIGIPVVGAGEYGMPFELAARIAVVSTANALIDWIEKDPESFEMAELKRVVFFIYHEKEEIRKELYRQFISILEEYDSLLRKNRKMVFQSSFKAQKRYIWEIVRYDTTRGYFSVAQKVRLVLMCLRFIYFPSMLLKDKLGKNDWKKRRQVVELTAFLKVFLPVLLWYIGDWLWGIPVARGILIFLDMYLLTGTLSYLLALLLYADIQRASANIIRSLIMLFVNYVEVSLDMALLMHLAYGKGIGTLETVAYGVLGRWPDRAVESLLDYTFLYADSGIRFFFTSLIFGYFANHMRQRKFSS